jgi:hypothetical protein
MRRLLLALCLGLLAAVAPAQAFALEPTIIHTTIYGGPSPVTGLCPFEFTAESVIPVTITEFSDSSGNLVRIGIHATETDTFIGPGGTLTSAPYVGNYQLTPDSAFVQGVVVRVPLSGGTLFISAGRTDLLAQTDNFIFSPTVGRSGDMTAFCAALS